MSADKRTGVEIPVGDFVLGPSTRKLHELLDQGEDDSIWMGPDGQFDRGDRFSWRKPES